MDNLKMIVNEYAIEKKNIHLQREYVSMFIEKFRILDRSKKDP